MQSLSDSLSGWSTAVRLSRQNLSFWVCDTLQLKQALFLTEANSRLRHSAVEVDMLKIALDLRGALLERSLSRSEMSTCERF